MVITLVIKATPFHIKLLSELQPHQISIKTFISASNSYQGFHTHQIDTRAKRPYFWLISPWKPSPFRSEISYLAYPFSPQKALKNSPNRIPIQNTTLNSTHTHTQKRKPSQKYQITVS